MYTCALNIYFNSLMQVWDPKLNLKNKLKEGIDNLYYFTSSNTLAKDQQAADEQT